MHGFIRLEKPKPHAASAYQAAYGEALTIEGALRSTGAFTPRSAEAPGPPKRTRE